MLAPVPNLPVSTWRLRRTDHRTLSDLDGGACGRNGSARRAWTGVHTCWQRRSTAHAVGVKRRLSSADTALQITRDRWNIRQLPDIRALHQRQRGCDRSQPLDVVGSPTWARTRDLRIDSPSCRRCTWPAHPRAGNRPRCAGWASSTRRNCRRRPDDNRGRSSTHRTAHIEHRCPQPGTRRLTGQPVMPHHAHAGSVLSREWATAW
jgi:hypothetical protein